MLAVLVPMLGRDNELEFSDAAVALPVRMSAAMIHRRLGAERFNLMWRGRAQHCARPTRPSMPEKKNSTPHSLQVN